jgi:hypothetical protein
MIRISPETLKLKIMAGGKETPRQKMIGMMYLVLTALLALNVSKTILDAFVAIEDNIQVSNENEVLRGEEKRLELRESAQSTEPAVSKKAMALLKTAEEIDRITAAEIGKIDRLKMDILRECGEDVDHLGKNGHIVYEKFADPLRPARLKLEFVEGKDKYDEPMRILIGDDITNPGAAGKKLWNDYLTYRNKLTELLASSNQVDGKRWYFKAPDIRSFSSQRELMKRIGNAIDASEVHPDDREMIRKIYASLTKQERSTVNDVKNVHWIGKTFDHAPSVAAIASLSSMQKEILTARADAISLIRGRISTGDFSFNRIMPLAYGPEVINQGEEAEIQVLMAAYDSDRDPKVVVSGGTLRETKEGKGFVNVKGSGSEMKLTGTITVVNKSGIPKTLPWEKTIRVMKPSGVVSLPKLNVLYRNYPNMIAATASGYEETVVAGSSGLGIKKSGDGYIGTISTSARTATITVSGRNRGTGKTQALGTYTFRVSNLPPPAAWLGTVPSGTVSVAQLRSMTSVFVKYPPEILLDATFSASSWTMQVGKNPAEFSGSGSALTEKARSALKQAKPGDKISITVKYKGPVSGTAAIILTVI